MTNSPNSTSKVRMVVPCYNEAERWPADYWAELTADPTVEWVFVDDGSADATRSILDRIATQPNCSVVAHPKNKGKGEAVRTGLNHVLADGAEDLIVGFVDCDGSFTVYDVQRFIRLATDGVLRDKFDAVWSARVPLSGREISRSTTRSIAGRIIRRVLRFAYPALPFDTQVGFKLFFADPELAACLQEPFSTRWFFDVEMLIRWSRHAGSTMRVWEEPLMSCLDVPRGAINARQYRRIIGELFTVVRTAKHK
jgi:glycosyltransferase involved in cell wall biosynthesis